MLRKRPQLIKLLCAVVVFLGLILSLVPVMAGLDKDSDNSDSYLKQSTVARILWPMCFMFGFVSYHNHCIFAVLFIVLYKLNVAYNIIH